ILLCSSSSVPFVSSETTDYEFYDDSSEVELRLGLRNEALIPAEISVDATETCLVIKVRNSTVLDTTCLYGTIKPSETIWYIDDDQLVVNLKKQDTELKWPDITESWESLTDGVAQLLKGTSVFLVGESTDINRKVARELAVGIRYTPLCTKELVETYMKRDIDSWFDEEGGCDAIVEAESAILESLSRHARAVVATIGGKHGAAGKATGWRHLYAGFCVWLAQSEDAGNSKPTKRNDEGRRRKEDYCYRNAEAVVKIGGVWDSKYSKAVAKASLSALKRLLLSDKHLTGRKSLYVRLGCRGDWPEINISP
ncbi:shikimate kinase-like protein, partial [Genlisea aurea]